MFISGLKNLLIALVCAVVAFGPAHAAKPSFDGKMVVGYYSAGAAGKIAPRYDKLSLICLAFAHMKADGTLDYERLLPLKQLVDSAHMAGTKVIVSLRDTKDVSLAIADPTLRKNLARQTKECIDALGLDGVDIDYEEWGGDDATKRRNLEEFYKDIRGEIGEDYLMTAAVRAPTGPQDFLDSQLLSHLDYVFPMIYDACGAEGELGWGTPGQHSSYEYFEAAVDYFINGLKVPASKICAGVPFYGYEFKNTESVKNGVSATYRRILERFPDSDIHNRDQEGLLWFNGLPTMRSKCRHAMEKDLAGIMIWEITQDTDNAELSLLNAINEELGKR